MTKTKAPTKTSKPRDEKHLNNILMNILSITITIFLALASGIFFLSKFDNRLENTEQGIKDIRTELVEFKNDIIEINKLNNTSVDNKIYIYMYYSKDDNIDKLIKMTNDQNEKQINSILNKKTTK